MRRLVLSTSLVLALAGFAGLRTPTPTLAQRLDHGVSHHGIGHNWHGGHGVGIRGFGFWGRGPVIVAGVGLPLLPPPVVPVPVPVPVPVAVPVAVPAALPVCGCPSP